MNSDELKRFLDKKVAEYNRPSFIPADPISIPHRYKKKQDIEIAAFFASIFAWGNRTTIINKTTELLQLMDDAPHRFIMQHSDGELKKLLSFKHRTFNTTDLLYFLLFLKHHYKDNASLETAFSRWLSNKDATVEKALIGFHNYFFSLEGAPIRTRKHIATPMRNSTCKRLNMFLRWMVRKDDNGVDFGIWKSISPRQLVCPVDVHVARVARQFGLITRKQTDWLSAVELTSQLKTFDSNDPVKYDFALFSIGATEKFLTKDAAVMGDELTAGRIFKPSARTNHSFNNLPFFTMDITAALQKLTTEITPDEKAGIAKELSVYLNHLLLNDFSALVQILYRVDVPEENVAATLQQNNEVNAGDLLAELLIERQKQKLLMRPKFPSENLSNEEGWG